MPSERTHRRQAEQNERLAKGLILLSPQLLAALLQAAQ